ncbi:non-heme iron oxygenase ferredoxin subunit [Burkholderia glumae]|uniref:Non-heme iron oxygenase ferredoxin subunit n=1 Tax=Burkholderia glumae TaxID=337 RepID=A0AAQ0BQN5_BURGL|nr:non-heme iron oxygenase ferredoxin subunit [Burkholderia glumae]ACR32333.1 putative ferredoxin [Burkholderia glumae BGR1]AJY63150.1 naphthalene 1,2-dioxygenase system ferredoxin subunit [Burkholderia glumae LMG 2196 = ATCC 33617]KHJ61551.1 naphthalene 1,2-dioxygenase [Burkholderia glumae]MCM2484474.1 non-heme iron oxygenase ferredoxin subunit [Burkholderia glumae]MCM2510166.1 non-heme iron oxygenase ferredoxin subunit [Burkholderia glumae]
MTTEWTYAAETAAVREQGLTGVIVGGRDIALFAIDDEIFATDNQCTHGEARLSDGFLLDDEVECPLHQGRFSVRTGAALCAPVTACVKTFPVRIESGRVFVRFDAGLDNDGPGASTGEHA